MAPRWKRLQIRETRDVFDHLIHRGILPREDEVKGSKLSQERKKGKAIGFNLEIIEFQRFNSVERGQGGSEGRVQEKARKGELSESGAGLQSPQSIQALLISNNLQGSKRKEGGEKAEIELEAVVARDLQSEMLNLVDKSDGLKAREGRGEMACREANSRGTEGLPAPRVPQPTHQGGRTQQMRSLEEEEDQVPEFGQQVGGHVEEEGRRAG